MGARSRRKGATAERAVVAWLRSLGVPADRTSSRNMAFTVPAVPTGMKAGVLISPREVSMRPRRPMPSVARREKEKSDGVLMGRSYTAHRGRESLGIGRRRLRPRDPTLDPSPQGGGSRLRPWSHR